MVDGRSYDFSSGAADVWLEVEEDAEELTVGPGLAVCSVGWEVVMCWKVETGDCTKKSNGCWLFKSKRHILLEVSIGIDMV